ncbi:helix-turn-helix transcriptional regulator, partial [Salmonella enterica]|uniref:helix-turn-helix transcriptional regulator n=1 Tax=Salmonella enterica TaxID=28901 RepID=UPI003299380F
MIALARAAEVSYGHLRMFETGDRNISAELAHRIARVLTEQGGRPVTVEEFTSAICRGVRGDVARGDAA